MSEWDKRLTPNFTDVARNLRPSLLVDSLLELGLLLPEEHGYVESLRHLADEELATILRNDILRKKENRAFDLFCRVLLAIPGQEFIATDILGYRADGSGTFPTPKRDNTASSIKPVDEVTASRLRPPTGVPDDVSKAACVTVLESSQSFSAMEIAGAGALLEKGVGMPVSTPSQKQS